MVVDEVGADVVVVGALPRRVVVVVGAVVVVDVATGAGEVVVDADVWGAVVATPPGDDGVGEGWTVVVVAGGAVCVARSGKGSSTTPEPTAPPCVPAGRRRSRTPGRATSPMPGMPTIVAASTVM
ncbi:MAG TPA: hypothetical protein VHN98_09010 [Acidimicrobiales bacterium]|nr:hypothetical protein [Acidimicrobiales bacterium]